MKTVTRGTGEGNNYTLLSLGFWKLMIDQRTETGFKMWHFQEQDGYQTCQSRAYVLSNRKA